ncbi:UDP-glucosyltransferase 2-like [Ostrinia nubilalis]|uniref:UDP-glucosyltransferase 2-like n=1 Tax=Ostrinia nubilalis TaxID=29057 RepID=UPI0030824B52
MHYWPLLLLTWVELCLGYNILALLPYPGKSHHMVFEPLLQELANRGHRLTVVSFFPSKNPHPNRREVSLVGLAPLNVEVINMTDFDRSYFGFARYFEHIPVVTKLAEMNLELCEKLLDAEVFKEFVNAEGNYDLILVEHFNSDCMLGLVHNYGVPSVGLMSCAIMQFTPSRVGSPDNPAYVPNMVLPMTDTMSFLERFENALVLFGYELWYELAIRWKEQRVLEKKFGRLPRLEEIGKNASVILVNTHHSLNGVRELPPSVVEVGGIHLHNRTMQPLPRELKQWIEEAQDGFIVFSFGSLIKGSTLPASCARAILKVFARLPQRVLWKWEAEGMELPENVRLMKWLPQYELLTHRNCVAFISHAGALSLTEAVSAGVPLLAIPILGDQFGNAAHAKRAGLAEVLPLRELTEEAFEAALRKVLDERMRTQAKRLSEIWKDKPMDPMDRAVFYVEKTARYKGLNMSTDARYLNRIQLAMLDIAAFLLAVVVILGWSIVWVFRKCKRKILWLVYK